MLGRIIRLMYNGLTIERRNNYPRIEKVVETEHLGLLIHYTVILYYLLNKSDIDLLKVFKYIFWKSYFTFIYSDINSFVKLEIKRKRKDLYNKLEELIKEFLLSIKLPDSILDDIRQVYKEGYLSDQEIRFLQLAKLLTVKKEIEVNSRIYYSVYKDSIKNINLGLNNLMYYINSENFEKINFYMDQVKRLKFSFRWNRLNRYYTISVLSHLYIVFGIGYIIGKLENFSDEDLLELLLRSIFHDIPEALTGDIVSPTKKAVDGLEFLIGQIEEELVEKNLLDSFDYRIKKDFSKWMLKPFDGKIGKFVKYADLLSALWEARIEKDGYFKKIYQTLKRKLWETDVFSLQYILKFGDEYFMDDVEEIWQKFLYNIKK